MVWKCRIAIDARQELFENRLGANLSPVRAMSVIVPLNMVGVRSLGEFTSFQN